MLSVFGGEYIFCRVHTRWWLVGFILVTEKIPPYFGWWPYSFEFRPDNQNPNTQLDGESTYSIKSEIQADVLGEKWIFLTALGHLSPFLPHTLCTWAHNWVAEWSVAPNQSFDRTFSQQLAIFSCFRAFQATLTAYADIFAWIFVTGQTIRRRIDLRHRQISTTSLSENRFFFRNLECFTQRWRYRCLFPSWNFAPGVKIERQIVPHS